MTTITVKTPDRKAVAIRMVHEFFNAFDARDMMKIEACFAPAACIIHHNGVMNDIPTLLMIVKNAETWAPRTRELSNFEFKELGHDNLLVTFQNYLVAFPGTLDETPYTYMETWLLQSIGSEFQALHIHYSMVTATEHSEG